MYRMVMYSMQMTLSLAVLYAVYYLLLRREKMPPINRIVLGSIIFLSFAIPLWSWFDLASRMPIVEQWSLLLPAVTIRPASTGAASAASIPIELKGILGVYVLGVCFRFISVTNAYRALFHLLHAGKHYKQADGSTVVTLAQPIAPFSWLRYIFLSNEDYAADITSIIRHEQAHIRRYHSWDIIFIQILLIFFWFNPILWLIKQDLQDIHEYEADQEVLNSGIDATKYQLLLIRQATSNKRFKLVNALNHSSLKKRIIMMQKKQSSKRAISKILWLVPLVVVITLVFSCTNKSKQEVKKEAEKVESAEIEKTKTKTPEDQVFTVVEHMPEYPGGVSNLMSFIGKSVSYPAVAQSNGIEGRVICSFIVNTDGSVSDAKVVRGVDPSLDKEALRVIGLMPKWTPGRQRGQKVRVQYTLPIAFKLQ